MKTLISSNYSLVAEPALKRGQAAKGKPARIASPELSVVVLGYGEEGRLPSFITAVETEVRKLEVTYEIVLVANYWPGSGDRTPEVAAELAKHNERVRVLAKPKDGRMGWDMRSGLDFAQGNILAVIDGDGQFHPNDIVKLYREMRSGQFDFCQTYRVCRADGWKRRITSKIYNLLFRALFPGVRLLDINAKPKLITRSAYQAMHLTSDDWFIDAEMVIQARRFGYRTGQIPSIFGKKESKSYVTKATMLEFLKNLFLFRTRETLYSLQKLLPPD